MGLWKWILDFFDINDEGGVYYVDSCPRCGAGVEKIYSTGPNQYKCRKCEKSWKISESFNPMG